ncbi:MAG: tetratricopeptide repeat protein [Acidobacteriota bacterium]
MWCSWPINRRWMAVGTVLVALAIGGTEPRAQDDLAARLLENGDQLQRDGKVEQARAAWSDVVAHHPDSPAAPAALDRLGTSLYAVETFDLRGRQTGETTLEQAREIFERLATNYRTAPEASRAAFKLGLLFSDPVSPFLDLDDAYGWFSSIVTVYPDSAYLDRGLYGLATILFQQGKVRQSLRPASRLLADAPDSPITDRVRFLAARALIRLGDLDGALRLLQAVLDVTPDSPLASASRDRLTHLVRLMRAGEAAAVPMYDRFGRIVPRLPAEWRLRTVSGLATDPADHLLVVDGRAGVVHLLDGRGRPVGRVAARRATAAWADGGQVLVGTPDGVVIGGRSHTLVLPGGTQTVSDVGFVARDTARRIIVWDRKAGRVLRFRRDFSFDKDLISGRDGRVDAVAGGADGSIAVLDARRRVITIYAEAGGSRQVRLAPEEHLRRPSALALDFAGNLVVLDRSAREVGVFTPQGKEIARVVSGRGPDDPFPDPTYLAVNNRGEILIYDRKHDAIVVLR